MPGNLISITPEDIASWPTPNYVDPMERNWMPIYASILYAMGTLMVVTRLGLRARNKAGGLGLDDAFLVAAWLGGTMFAIDVNVGAVSYNLGRHVWDVPVQSYEKIAEITWVAELTFLFAGGCTKISVLLFYRRLPQGTHQSWRWAVIGAVVFTAAWTLAFMLTLVFNCSPTEAYWKAFDPNYHGNHTCVDTTVVNVLAGIFAALSDLYSVVLPCLMVRHFALPGPQKVALNVLFCLGVLVVAASAMRTYYLYEVGHNSDVSWLLFDVLLWSTLELQLGIMCCCAPALRVFCRDYLSRPFQQAMHDPKHSETPAQGNRESALSGVVIRRISGPDDHYQRTDFSARHCPKGSADTTVSQMEVDSSSPSSTAPSSHYLIKTPADYEAYSLQTMERYRESISGRPDSRGRHTRNFSQPFGHTQQHTADI